VRRHCSGRCEQSVPPRQNVESRPRNLVAFLQPTSKPYTSSRRRRSHMTGAAPLEPVAPNGSPALDKIGLCFRRAPSEHSGRGPQMLFVRWVMSEGARAMTVQSSGGPHHFDDDSAERSRRDLSGQ